MPETSYLADLVALAPEAILAATALALVGLSAWWDRRHHRAAWLALPAVVVLVITCLWLGGRAWIDGGFTGRPGNPVLPEIMGLTAVFGLVLLADAIDRRRSEPAVGDPLSWLPSAVVLVGLGLAAWRLFARSRGLDAGYVEPVFVLGSDPEDRLVRLDAFAAVCRALILFSLAAATLFAHSDRESDSRFRGLDRLHWHSTIVAAHVGALFLVETENLALLWIATECVAICSYLHVAIGRSRRETAEASLKLFGTGALATSTMLFGVAVLYGYGGGFSVDTIGGSFESIERSGGLSILASVGWVCLFAGIAWKLALVPFHFWSPDTLQAAPIGTCVFASVGIKVAGVAVILRVFMASSGAYSWTPLFAAVFAVLAALSMTYGNLAASRQSNLKRMIGYAVIAQVGFIMTAVAAFFAFDRSEDASIVSSHASDAAVIAVLMQLFAYVIAIVGLFGSLLWFANRVGSFEIEDLHGEGHRAPWMTTVVVVFVVSLIGLPPFVGFIARLEMVRAPIAEQGLEWLAFVAVINIFLSAFYWVRVVLRLLERTPQNTQARVERSTLTAENPILLTAALAALAVLTLALGLMPNSIFEIARAAALGLRL